MADELENFAIEMNAARNGFFFVFAVLLHEMAASKGQDASTWLFQTRQRVLSELDRAKMAVPEDELDPINARIAETARATIGAIFDLAQARVRHP